MIRAKYYKSFDSWYLQVCSVKDHMFQSSTLQTGKNWSGKKDGQWHTKKSQKYIVCLLPPYTPFCLEICSLLPNYAQSEILCVSVRFRAMKIHKKASISMQSFPKGIQRYMRNLQKRKDDLIWELVLSGIGLKAWNICVVLTSRNSYVVKSPSSVKMCFKQRKSVTGSLSFNLTRAVGCR